MSFAANFERKVQSTLTHLVPKYRWETGWHADGRSKVDVVGLQGDVPKVLLEIELKKDNPVENVVKIWRWADEEGVADRILFLHAFSAHYLKARGFAAKPTKVKQYERAVFIGQQMANDSSCRISYKEVPIRTKTRRGNWKFFRPLLHRGVTVKQGGGAMLRAAEHLARDVAKLLRSKSH